MTLFSYPLHFHGPQPKPGPHHPIHGQEKHFLSWEESVNPTLHVTDEETESQKGETCAQGHKLFIVKPGTQVSWPFHYPTDKLCNSSSAPFTCPYSHLPRPSLGCLPISPPGWASSHVAPVTTLPQLEFTGSGVAI